MLTSYYDLPDFISTNTPIVPHIPMRERDCNCTSQTNWFDCAGTHCSVSEHEPLNAFESIEGLLNTEVDDHILPAVSSEQPDGPSAWNTY